MDEHAGSDSSGRSSSTLHRNNLPHHLLIKSQWDERYEQLIEWKSENGHCQVPKAQGALGRWVARQRELRKKKKLSREREALLQNLDFTWNTNEAAWEARFQQLQLWKRDHGHSCVPIAVGELGMWCAKARQLKRKNKLSQERIEKLESIGFTWSTASADWHEKFQSLKVFRDRYGHTDVPIDAGDLGWWVNSQRQSKRKGKLIQDREHLLDSIGFCWHPRRISAGLSVPPVKTSRAVQEERLRESRVRWSLPVSYGPESELDPRIWNEEQVRAGPANPPFTSFTVTQQHTANNYGEYCGISIAEGGNILPPLRNQHQRYAQDHSIPEPIHPDVQLLFEYHPYQLNPYLGPPIGLDLVYPFSPASTARQ